MEKVTFKQFFTTLGAGIWQSICWFCNLCGYKTKVFMASSSRECLQDV